MEVDGGTQRLDEENGRRIYVAKKMVSEFANTKPEVTAPSEVRNNTSNSARQDDVGLPQESANTRWLSSSTSGNDVEMRSISAGKRPLEPGGADDMVCGLEVCDELVRERLRRRLYGRNDGSDTLARRLGPSTCGQVRSLRSGDGRDRPVKNWMQTHLMTMERHQPGPQ